MPIFTVEMTRWEPQYCRVEIEAETHAGAAKAARIIAKDVVGGMTESFQCEPDTQQESKVSIISVRKETPHAR